MPQSLWMTRKAIRDEEGAQRMKVIEAMHICNFLLKQWMTPLPTAHFQPYYTVQRKQLRLQMCTHCLLPPGLSQNKTQLCSWNTSEISKLKQEENNILSLHGCSTPWREILRQQKPYKGIIKKKCFVDLLTSSWNEWQKILVKSSQWHRIWKANLSAEYLFFLFAS